MLEDFDKILKKYRTSLEIVINMESFRKKKFLNGLYESYRNDSYVNNLAENCLIRGTAEDVKRIDEITGLEFEIIYEIVSEKCERIGEFESGSLNEAEYLLEGCRNGMAHSNYAEIADRVMDNYIKQGL
ncbi:MAG: hypothetical protein KAT28_05410 [Candidatus Aenigmarchaeota archaeon]|nr:hypothetical protein [Candidatus Aenigmarchaeota archaeon]